MLIEALSHPNMTPNFLSIAWLHSGHSVFPMWQFWQKTTCLQGWSIIFARLTLHCRHSICFRSSKYLSCAFSSVSSVSSNKTSTSLVRSGSGVLGSGICSRRGLAMVTRGSRILRKYSAGPTRLMKNVQCPVAELSCAWIRRIWLSSKSSLEKMSQRIVASQKKHLSWSKTLTWLAK